MNDQSTLLDNLKTLHNRRGFLRRASIAGAAAAVAPAAAAFLTGARQRQSHSGDGHGRGRPQLRPPTRIPRRRVLLLRASGNNLIANSANIYGAGAQGTLTIKPNPLVPFANPLIQQFANELAVDELTHVNFLRGTLFDTGLTYYGEPDIDLYNSFNTLAAATNTLAGTQVIPGGTFDPFASDVNFLIGAFIFEDVGVTAYAGGAPLITNPDYLASAAGIQAVEAYHAAGIRTMLFNMSQEANSVATYGVDIIAVTTAISNLRNTC